MKVLFLFDILKDSRRSESFSFCGTNSGNLIKTLIANECGYTKFSKDPFTDVNQLASKYDFNCLNLGCGYYRQHTNSEYVVVEEVSDSIKAGYELITKLGLVKYIHKKVEKKTLVNETNYSYASYNDNEDYDFEEDEYDELAESISDLVIDMYMNGVSEEEIKEEVADYLRGMY